MEAALRRPAAALGLARLRSLSKDAGWLALTAQRAALESRLADFEQFVGPQIVVLMVSTTQPEDIAAFAQRVGETWKIGRPGVGDGLLLIVAKDDGRLWIAPAKALERVVPDSEARQVSRDVIAPALREGNYFGGLERGVQALIGRISGEGLPKMVAVPPGSFMMGSPASEEGRRDSEGPVREVRIAYTLEVGQHEVTRREFGRFLAATGYRTEAERDVGAQGCAAWGGSKWEYTAGRHWRNPGFDQGEDHPVLCVSWNDAQAYLRWLNESLPGRGYRLLSEAEWEYVARAERGSTPYPWGNDEGGREQCAWANGADATARRQIAGASGWTVANCSDEHAYTAPVGSYRANAFGLHDLHGNVWEWVQDVWHDNYAGAPSDGSAWMTGGDPSRRVLRGGSWFDSPRILRSAGRNWSTPDYRIDIIGFRIARTL